MNNNILKQIKLLYVEDDDSIRGILSKGLKRRVKELEVARNGMEGFEKYKSFKPDIIVTDIKMPKMNGLEMSKRIRQLDKLIPIIITSAHGESETLMEAIDIGVNGYILKPIDTDKLFETIVLYSKSKVLENELKNKEKQLFLQSKNAALGEMIHNIAHQWRQPLSIISTSASSMQMNTELGIVDEEQTAKYLDIILTTTQDLSTTIDSFSNTSASNKEEEEYFNLSKTIDDALKNIKSKIEKNNIQIVKNIDDNLSIHNHSNLFLQSIISILLNAIDAFEDLDMENKYIFIDLNIHSNKFIINIKDNAGGIPENIIDNICEPYTTTKHKSSGKGLGLYTTLIMIQNGMNGNIEWKNCNFEYENKQYKGAIFSIILKNN